MKNLKKLVTTVRSWFAWRYIGRSGCFGYWENDVTGKRTAKWVGNLGSTALHRSWLCGAPWDHEHYPLEEQPK